MARVRVHVGKKLHLGLESGGHVQPQSPGNAKETFVPRAVDPPDPKPLTLDPKP